jgi:DNA-binding transcriptional LysR family regulator
MRGRGHLAQRILVLRLIAIGDNAVVELRQLAYFVAVAEELNFTRGSRRVHVVQSAVSAAIQKLERELGTLLFHRHGPQISLTDAGAALLPEARAALAAAERARDVVDQVRDGLRGAVTIGTMLSTASVDLPALLGRFHAAHPGVTVRLRLASAGSTGHVQAIMDGSIDMALVSTPGRPPAGVRLHHLTDEPLRLICPPRHPMANAASVTVDQLAAESFVDFPAGWGNRAVVDRVFTAAGHVRDVRFEAADFASALGLVRNGLGVTFLPDSAATRVTDLAVIPVDADDLILPVSLATAATRTPSAAASALIGEIRALPASQAQEHRRQCADVDLPHRPTG